MCVGEWFGGCVWVRVAEGMAKGVCFLVGQTVDD